jgi:hypothetical protein
MNREEPDRESEVPAHNPASSRKPEFRLLVIPILIYIAWALDIWLLNGRVNLYSRTDPGGLLLYTVVACVLVGVIVPILWIRVSFISGVVNMFQIGFRSPKRTVAACSGTILIVYVLFVIVSPFGPDRAAFFNAFLLLLPTAIASVMICWTLVGTHVQAYVRTSGALVSIHVGVAVTTLAFCLTALAYGSTVQLRDALFWFACIGILSALFFFAVRDIYATVILVAGLTVFALGERIDPSVLHGSEPVVLLSAAIAGAALVVAHWYFTRNFTTILVPENPGIP